VVTSVRSHTVQHARRPGLLASGLGGGVVEVCADHLRRAVAALSGPDTDLSVSPTSTPPG